MVLQEADSVGPYRAHLTMLIGSNPIISILKHTIRLVIERREILRTTFYKAYGINCPLKVIAEIYLPAFRIRDLGGIGSTAVFR